MIRAVEEVTGQEGPVRDRAAPRRRSAQRWWPAVRQAARTRWAGRRSTPTCGRSSSTPGISRRDTQSFRKRLPPSASSSGGPLQLSRAPAHRLNCARGPPSRVGTLASRSARGFAVANEPLVASWPGSWPVTATVDGINANVSFCGRSARGFPGCADQSPDTRECELQVDSLCRAHHVCLRVVENR